MEKRSRNRPSGRWAVMPLGIGAGLALAVKLLSSADNMTALIAAIVLFCIGLGITMYRVAFT